MALGMLFWACSGPQTENNAAEAPMSTEIVQLSAVQIKNAGIETGDPEKKSISSILKVNGIIDVSPENQFFVSVPIGGYVRKTVLIPGMKVAKGSVLAVLEDQAYIQLQQDYLTAKNKLSFLEQDYNRQKGLNESKATSDKGMQQVQSEYMNQRILVRSLAEQLRLIGITPERLNENNISRSISLRAPISGYVVRVNASTGKYVNPEDVLFELVNPGNALASLAVFENDASKLAVGQKVQCSVSSDPSVKYNATVVLIAPGIGENRAMEVHARLDGKGKELLPGTFVSAEIELTNANAVALPSAAIVKWENRNFVFAEEKTGTYHMVPVETGTESEGFTEIRSQLPEQKIVVKNAYTLLMKMKNSEEE